MMKKKPNVNAYDITQLVILKSWKNDTRSYVSHQSMYVAPTTYNNQAFNHVRKIDSKKHCDTFYFIQLLLLSFFFGIIQLEM